MRRSRALGVLAVLVVGAGGALLWRARRAPDASAEQVGDARGVVGAETCRGCHTAAYDAWSDSFHAKNAARPSADSVIGDFETNPTYAYKGTTSRMIHEGDSWRMRYTDAKGVTEERTIDWVLGRARHQVYLTRLDNGSLQVLPTYWNVEEGRWRDSREGTVDGPDPQEPSHPTFWRNFGRTYQRACMECHAGRSEKRFDQKAYTYASTFEPTIDCEACHAPGATHVTAWLRQDRAAAAGTLPALGRLDLEGRIQNCAQCHARKRIYAEGYRPGDAFYDFFAPHVWEPGMFFADGRSSSLNYRWVDYMQNGCFERTTRTMDCGFCHPPHGLESIKDATVVQANAICTQCHLNHKTRLTEHTRHGAESTGSRCVECHMPPMPLDLRMTVRDHTIGSPLPELTRDFGAPNACNRCHAERDADWAQGFVRAWFGGQPHFEAYRAKMRSRAEVLKVALTPDARTPASVLAGWLDDTSRNVVERCSAAEMLRHGDNSTLAKAALLRHAEDQHPLVRYYVVSALEAFPGADVEAALRRATSDARRIVRVRGYVALIQRTPSVADEPAMATVREEHRVREEDVRVDDPRSKSHDALWHFQRGEMAQAETLLRDGAAMTWPVPGMRADLVQFLIEQGRLDDADAEVRALEENDARSMAARMSRAFLLMGQRRPAEALPLLDGLLDEGVSTPVIEQARGQAAAQIGAPPRNQR